MRIRKRQVPLPLSSLTPVPLSDPLFNRSLTVVQLKLPNNHSLHHLAQEADKFSCFDPQPSDRVNRPIGAGSTGQDRSLVGGEPEEKKVSLKKKGEKEDEGEKSKNDAGNGSFILGAKIETRVPQQPTSLSAQVGSWCEGEHSFRLKKGRGVSFKRRSNGETIIENDKKIKTKMNKKCLAQNGNELERKEDNNETSKVVNGGTTRGKKRARDGACLLEGSRCSRVNGRGWRCCQQTLVGYSLCEHHLGKGRLRSVSTVRSRSMGKNSAPKKTQPQPITSHSLKENEKKGVLAHGKVHDGGQDNEDEKQPLMISKRKIKPGVVKARSISSLLGQVNDTIEFTDDNK